MEDNFNKYKWIYVWAFVSLAFLVVIHFLFHWVGPTWIQARWTAREMLTYASTVSLGLLALWQNQKMQEVQSKKETYTLAIENYALFHFENFKADFYNSDNPSHFKDGLIIEGGFNGYKAVWKLASFDSLGINSVKFIIQIKNIGNTTATNIFVSDRDGNNLKGTNVLSSPDGSNDQKYIINGNTGLLILNCQLSELQKKKKIEYYLNFTNPFGSKYRQLIKVISNYGDKILQVDAQCVLNIVED